MKAQTTITIDWLKIAEGIGWLIALLASVPYSNGQIATLFPPSWRGWVTGIFAGAAIAVNVYRAMPALPFNKPAGGAIGPEDIKPAALAATPTKCPACGHIKRKARK